jgi:molybdenum cofactor synthesis domain-containing protein
MTDGPSATLLIIGNEVLSGKVEDQNGPFLIRALRERGIETRELRIIADIPERITRAVQELAGAATYLFTTGGIGPTHDDVTIAAVAAAFGVGVHHDPELLRWLHERHGDELSPARLRLAEVPDGATVHTGAAAPMAVIQVHNVFVLPGVPALMRLCFDQIAEQLGQAELYSRSIYLNIGEAAIATAVGEVQNRHSDVAIGSYPSFERGPYRVRLTVDGRDRDAVDRALADLERVLDPAWRVEPPD